MDSGTELPLDLLNQWLESEEFLEEHEKIRIQYKERIEKIEQEF